MNYYQWCESVRETFDETAAWEVEHNPDGALDALYDILLELADNSVPGYNGDIKALWASSNEFWNYFGQSGFGSGGGYDSIIDAMCASIYMTTHTRYCPRSWANCERR